MYGMYMTYGCHGLLERPAEMWPIRSVIIDRMALSSLMSILRLTCIRDALACLCNAMNYALRDVHSSGRVPLVKGENTSRPGIKQRIGGKLLASLLLNDCGIYAGCMRGVYIQKKKTNANHTQCSSSTPGIQPTHPHLPEP